MHSIFTGRLLLPLLSPLRRTAAVTLGDATPVAVLRRKFVSKRRQFDVLDTGATTLLATGAATSLANDHHRLVGPRSEVIQEYLIDYAGRRRGDGDSAGRPGLHDRRRPQCPAFRHHRPVGALGGPRW
ncbi:MAG TPA: hypothetical protein VN408_03830 [Actinoplanes sp.]|nr:hypothetical protein [Actinoplanes sp.]